MSFVFNSDLKGLMDCGNFVSIEMSILAGQILFESFQTIILDGLWNSCFHCRTDSSWKEISTDLDICTAELAL